MKNKYDKLKIKSDEKYSYDDYSEAPYSFWKALEERNCQFFSKNNMKPKFVIFAVEKYKKKKDN